MIEKEQSCNNKSHIFIFEEARTKDPRCENLIKQIWRDSRGTLTRKLKVVQELNKVFKEYRSGNVAKELRRIETLLKKDKRWEVEEGEIRKYKALESQWKKLLGIEETI